MRIKGITKIAKLNHHDGSRKDHTNHAENTLYLAGSLEIAGNILGFSDVIISTNHINLDGIYADNITIDQGALVKVTEMVSKVADLGGELIVQQATIDDLYLLETSAIEGSINVVNLDSKPGAKIKAMISTYWQQPKRKQASKPKSSPKKDNHI